MNITSYMKIVMISCLLIAVTVTAEQIRYIDSSGNIRFVDSLSQVPQRYKSQVVPPTPTAVIDHNSVMRANQERMLYQQQQQQRRQQEQQRQMQLQIDQNRRKTEEVQRRTQIERQIQLERDSRR